MSILIEGMEMPTDCNDCRFAVDGWCYAYGKPNIDALDNDGITNFCPLVHVPPHGDLIDRDEIKYDWDEDNQAWGYDIHSAPTIIPADKEGEG